jgi:hypothetical protein
MTNGYPYHQIRLPDLAGCCHRHCWFDLHTYGVRNINNNNTCNNGCLIEYTIIHWRNTRRWLNSPCYWDVWVSSFLFWFIFDNLCTNHYHASLTKLLHPLDACFLLSITCVHSPTMCASHNNSLAGCCT